MPPDASKAEYQIQTTGATESQFEMLCRLELSEAAHRDLLDYCYERNIFWKSVMSWRNPKSEICNPDNADNYPQ